MGYDRVIAELYGNILFNTLAMDHRLDGRNLFCAQRIFYNNILKQVIIHMTKLFLFNLFNVSIVGI